MKKRILLLFSGGSESTLLLVMAKELGYEVSCLMFDYGQRHVGEVEVGAKFCQQYDILPVIMQINLPTKSNLTKEGKTYANVSPFHVPSRNLIFVSLAASYAEANEIDTIWLGASYEDRKNLFPDCYQEWVYQVNNVLAVNGSSKIVLEAPLLGCSKEMIQKLLEKFNIKPNQIYSGHERK